MSDGGITQVTTSAMPAGDVDLSALEALLTSQLAAMQALSAAVIDVNETQQAQGADVRLHLATITNLDPSPTDRNDS